nr:zinc-ribbon domain-containing protein [Candidatus Sigynarchaeota archaeon]
MPTYYSYNCQVCGTRMYMQSSVRRCNFCMKALCNVHDVHGFCPVHDRILLPNEKSTLKAANFWKRSACCCSCGLFLLTMFAQFLLLENIIPYQFRSPGVFIGVAIAVAVVIPLIIYFSAKSSWNSTAEKAIARIKSELDAMQGGQPGQAPGAPYSVGGSQPLSFGQGGVGPFTARPSSPAGSSPAPFTLGAEPTFAAAPAGPTAPAASSGASEKKFCGNCGAPVADLTAEFCASCGSKLE